MQHVSFAQLREEVRHTLFVAPPTSVEAAFHTLSILLIHLHASVEWIERVPLANYFVKGDGYRKHFSQAIKGNIATKRLLPRFRMLDGLDSCLRHKREDRV